MSTITFSLGRDLDIEALNAAFLRDGRVRVGNFVAPAAAEALHRNLRARGDWQHVLYSAGKVVELSRDARAAMSPDQRRSLDDAVYAAARSSFQFRYEAIRVPDDDEARGTLSDPLADFARWLSHGDARQFLRAVTGVDAIDFADAQATAFSPGDFLTGHDDVVAGRSRHAAYVFGLNPVWRPEWGGLLLFHGDQGVTGNVPAFDTLDIFRVGQMHSVSEVNRAAAYRRYSVTGWLRSR